MTKIFGKEMTKQELFARVGHLQQIAGIKQYTFRSGRAEGVNAIEIGTGDFSFTLLPSRCLDIAFASYQGKQLGYLSKSGIRAPQYFTEQEDKGFLDNFYGGLLTTTGLNNIGASSIDQGKRYGMHGELSNIPADEVSCETIWEGDLCRFHVGARMKHSRFYGEDLLFERHVNAYLGESRVAIEDSVENLDFEPAVNMLLYHINFGYPLVDERTEFITSKIVQTQPRTEKAARNAASYDTLSAPTIRYEEECFYHFFEPNEYGFVYSALYNPSFDFSVYLKYDMLTLPYFVQWKLMRAREYVFGFAPCNSWCNGRGDAREKGILPMLEPFEKRTYHLELGIVEGRFSPAGKI